MSRPVGGLGIGLCAVMLGESAWRRMEEAHAAEDAGIEVDWVRGWMLNVEWRWRRGRSCPGLLVLRSSDDAFLYFSCSFVRWEGGTVNVGGR